jgi:DNA-binding transcriptional regulator/RsmH inhibitor MraZ
MYLFTGHRDHKIDGKDRIVVPSAYAAAIQADGEGALFLVPSADGRFLEAYPSDVFRGIADGQVPSRFEGDQSSKRVFFHEAEKAELNGPGRITIPKRFLELFPTREVRVCGMNRYLELWDPRLHEASVRGGGSPGGGAGGRAGPPRGR